MNSTNHTSTSTTQDTTQQGGTLTTSWTDVEAVLALLEGDSNAGFNYTMHTHHPFTHLQEVDETAVSILDANPGTNLRQACIPPTDGWTGQPAIGG